MPTEKDTKKLSLYFKSRVKHCEELSMVSKKALLDPVDINIASVDEYIKRKNIETCGRDSFILLQGEFKNMMKDFIKLGYSEGNLNRIEMDIENAFKKTWPNNL